MSFADIRDSWRNLAEIHAAPPWLWPALVAQMLADGWSVAELGEGEANVRVPRSELEFR